MTLSLDAVTQISRAVALEHGCGLEVIAVTSTEGGSERAELLLEFKGCHAGPCRISLNISRVDGDVFERDLRTKLVVALRAHLQVAPPE